MKWLLYLCLILLRFRYLDGLPKTYFRKVEFNCKVQLSTSDLFWCPKCTSCPYVCKNGSAGLSEWFRSKIVKKDPPPPPPKNCKTKFWPWGLMHLTRFCVFVLWSDELDKVAPPPNKTKTKQNKTKTKIIPEFELKQTNLTESIGKACGTTKPASVGEVQSIPGCGISSSSLDKICNSQIQKGKNYLHIASAYMYTNSVHFQGLGLHHVYMYLCKLASTAKLTQQYLHIFTLWMFGSQVDYWVVLCYFIHLFLSIHLVGINFESSCC